MENKDIFNNDEGNFKSLQKELRFKIGEQFELNEFHLKTLKSTVINGIEYENYEYLKDDFKTLFGLKLSSNIVLQYNGDVLFNVIYEFHIEHYKYLVSKINYFRIKTSILEVFLRDDNTCQLFFKKNLEAHF
jgi:hypothetical protein